MLVVCDFETHYAKDYTLSKMTTEQYVRDPRFKVHGVGIKWGTDDTIYYPEDEVDIAVDELRKEQHEIYILCHNTRFDGAILSWRYGIRPKFWLDTLSMARAVFPHESGSLSNLSKLCGLGAKGHEVENTLGKVTLTDEEQERLGAYCINDVELTYQLFQRLKKGFPVEELKVIDQTMRMFTEPMLELNQPLLEAHLDALKVRKSEVLGLHNLTALRSNDQFAQLLRNCGVEPPTKTSLRTGKETYAFAKSDEGMLALLEHEDAEVQALAAARLGVKSSIEETRTEAFIGISQRGSLPVPINYFGAQNTGRFSGADKLNLQNLPRGGTLRKAITAPEHHCLVVVDFAQIEARMLAYLAGQVDLIEAFARNEDVYCSMASKIFGRPITKADKLERQLGKTIILGCGYGMGWKKFGALLASGPLGAPPILFNTQAAADLRIPITVTPEEAAGVTTKLKGKDLLAHASVAKFLIDTYREASPAIPAYWKLCEGMLRDMAGKRKRVYGPICTDDAFILMPNGLKLQYKNLRRDDEGSWRYDGKRGEVQYIYGGKLCENIDQALSRIVMTEAMVKIGARYRVVLTVHDELVCCVPQEEGEECLAYMLEVMRTAPDWAKGLPLDAAGDIATSYGEAK